MRRKFNGIAKMPKAVWKSRGDWTPVYVNEQQHNDGIEFQHYIMSADNRLICAGVTRHKRMNRAQANQIFRVWRRWRTEYDTRFDGAGRDYPAKHYPTAADAATILVFPIDNPEQKEWYSLVA
jgi:hypothetical protein